jgi:acyl carrier protein
MDDKLKDILAAILGVSAADISDDTSPETHSKWDSLNHLNIITAVEKEFGITMKMKDIQGIDSYASLKSTVARMMA